MISYCEKTGFFYLNTPSTEYVIRILPDGTVSHVYYGGRLSSEELSYYNLFRKRAFSPMCNMGTLVSSPDCIPQEYPTFGRGDYRLPALEIEAADGRRVCELKYSSHKITAGKPKISGLPQTLAGSEEADTLEIELEDPVAGVKVSLFYTAFSKLDLIARHTEIKNIGQNRLKINRAASASFDLWLGDNFELLNLHGAWAREFATERTPLHHGITSCDSRRGSTGHQQNPFIALVDKNADEDHGEVYALALVYSSDFSMSVERDQFNGLRIQAGINPLNFSWLLESGETFTAPEALLTYTDRGLTAMSHTFHATVRGYLGKSAAANKNRQIVINNWEAMYYDFDSDKLKRFIESCKGLGIDTFVLDDGWFGRRNTDRTSLGDWQINREKLPGGFEEITETCRKCGMKFGLWFEPEMVSEDSELFRSHPDWCIQSPERNIIKSRFQYVLDFSRREVVDEVYRRVLKILRENDISYVKWYMNRNITDNGSDSLPNDAQGEHSHRYILGVYSLMERLTSEFPNILFEGCSGGGGRFDFGILYYMPQIWTSDDSDALERLQIQYGNSMVYPTSSMAAHVSATPNHQTGRVTPFKTRGAVAMMCNFGYELNISALNIEEIEEIRRQTERRRRLAPLVEEGILYRLADPFSGNNFAWQLVSSDKSFSCAAFVQKLSVPNDPGFILKLKGLDPDRIYNIEELGLRLHGDTLMKAGIPILPEKLDCYSLELTLTAE